MVKLANSTDLCSQKSSLAVRRCNLWYVLQN
uniref:Uncharacterized protein n=1 Tax=Arundo donax TaxID=35708 RepID=A0A0A9AIT1_ARUDO